MDGYFKTFRSFHNFRQTMSVFFLFCLYSRASAYVPTSNKRQSLVPPMMGSVSSGVKGSPPLSVKTNSAASLLRLLYSLSCLPAREDEVTCKCVALVSKSGSLWQAKGCHVVSVSTGWGLFRYLTLLLLIQAGLDFPKCSPHSVVTWTFKRETLISSIRVI